jgi:hypothetical protein
MAWSPPARKRRVCWVSDPGDYATLNSNHTPDGTQVISRLIKSSQHPSACLAQIENRAPCFYFTARAATLWGLWRAFQIEAYAALRGFLARG